jgi:hypothetical protein
MIIKVTDQILNLEGNPIEAISSSGEGDKGEKTFVTYRTVISNALNNFNQSETPTAEYKNKSWQIMKKLYDSDEVNLTVDDMAHIKERVGKIYSPLIYGRVSEIFEKPSEAPKK